MPLSGSAAILRDSFVKDSRPQDRVWIVVLMRHSTLRSITHAMTGSWQ